MRYLVSVVFLSLVFSCSQEKTNFTVSCILNEPVDRQLYLARLTLTGKIIADSAVADNNGTYKLKGYTGQADFYILYFDPDHYINLIISPGDKIRVNATVQGFEQDYSVEGSGDSRLVQRMVTRQALTLRSIADISEEYESNMGRPDFDIIKSRIDSAYDQIIAGHREFSIELIEENTSSLASLMALYQQLGRSTPVFDYKNDFNYYRLVDSVLSVLYPDSEAVRDLNRKVTELKEDLRVSPGAVAPEIIMPDPSGNPVSLSSLRGRFVLLFFGASWSDESNRQNSVLSALYSKAKDLGLEYYQVSLDRTKESWLRGVESNGAKGVLVSDGMYWDSPVVADYRIEQIPQLFLIDREGKIIDKGFSADEVPERLRNLTSNAQ